MNQEPTPTVNPKRSEAMKKAWIARREKQANPKGNGDPLDMIFKVARQVAPDKVRAALLKVISKNA